MPTAKPKPTPTPKPDATTGANPGEARPFDAAAITEAAEAAAERETARQKDGGSNQPNVRTAFVSLGRSGLKRWGGNVDEEFLTELKGDKARIIFREMWDNDPVVGAMSRTIEMVLRQVKWEVESAGTSPADKDATEFVKSCMGDMSHSWHDFIAEAMTFLPFGWAWHEQIFKLRRGADQLATSLHSQYTDGFVGWAKLPLRAQETLRKWEFDDDTGDAIAMVQAAPPDYTEHILPRWKALLFRTSRAKDNPEGRSILRNAYRPWYFKKNIEAVEGIGVERDLAGFPTLQVPPELLSTTATPEQVALREQLLDLVTALRRDEREGALIPNEDSGYKLTLLTTGGSRQFDTNAIIERYDTRIAMTAMADFILLGHGAVGSYALSDSKTDIFSVAVMGWLQMVAEEINSHGLPLLFRLNANIPGFPQVEKLPKLKPGPVETPDLNALGTFLSALTAAGIQLGGDLETENYLRRLANLPERKELPKPLAPPVPAAGGTPKPQPGEPQPGAPEGTPKAPGAPKEPQPPVAGAPRAPQRSTKAPLALLKADGAVEPAQRVLAVLKQAHDDVVATTAFQLGTLEALPASDVEQFTKNASGGPRQRLEGVATAVLVDAMQAEAERAYRAGMAAQGRTEKALPYFRQRMWDVLKGYRYAAHVQDVSEETRHAIAVVLRNGTMRGETPHVMALRLEKEVGFDANRARTVAETEVHGALNTAALDGFVAAGITHKRWVAMMEADPLPREWHMAAHGQVVPVDKGFRVGGEELLFPGDPGGMPDNIINCRCIMVPVVGRDVVKDDGLRTVYKAAGAQDAVAALSDDDLVGLTLRAGGSAPFVDALADVTAPVVYAVTAPEDVLGDGLPAGRYAVEDVTTEGPQRVVHLSWMEDEAAPSGDE